MLGRVGQWESYSSGQAPTTNEPILLCRIRASAETHDGLTLAATHSRRALHAHGGEDAVVGPVLVVLLVQVVVGAALLGAPVKGPVAKVRSQEEKTKLRSI